jgi:hypothetical protein
MGFLAEAMLFYQKVHLLADRTMLKSLLVRSKPDVLLEFLDSEFLQISYLDNFTGIQSENTGTPLETHKPVLCSIPDYAWEEYAPQLFAEAIDCSVKGGRRYAKRFSSFIKPISFDSSVERATLEDLSEGQYVQSAIAHLLKHHTPEYSLPQPLIFRLDRNGASLTVETNIDFVEANRVYHKRVSPNHSSLSVAYLLSNLIEARGNWHFASRFSSEIVTDSSSSVIFNLKFNDLIRRHQRSQQQLSVFQDFVFDDGRSIREAINSGSRDFADLLKLLSAAARFKKWLKGHQPDQQLLKEYLREVTKISWVDRLPTKSLRWFLFNAAGLTIDALGGKGLGTAGALSLSAFDQFLLDKLLRGWKPNQFVDQNLKAFVARDNL